MQVGRNSVLNHSYIKNFLKKLIVTAESSGHDVLDGLYEQYACYMTSFKVSSPLAYFHCSCEMYFSVLFC